MEEYDKKDNQVAEVNCKYCIHCGHEMPIDSNFCPECGKSQVETFNPQYELDDQQTKGSILTLIAYIFMLLTTIFSGIALIPLIWMIPMTIKTYRAYKGTEKLSTGFKICVLIFCNTISGILLLVDNK